MRLPVCNSFVDDLNYSVEHILPHYQIFNCIIDNPFSNTAFTVPNLHLGLLRLIAFNVTSSHARVAKLITTNVNFTYEIKTIPHRKLLFFCAPFKVIRFEADVYDRSVFKLIQLIGQTMYT